jgi:hypothetical protein
MGNKFASDNNALSECDVCGFRYKLRTLRYLIVKTKTTNVKACNECWSPDQPQLQLGMYPVDDPQAIRNPRPDFTGYPQSRSQVLQVIGMTTTSFVGQVTIS